MILYLVAQLIIIILRILLHYVALILHLIRLWGKGPRRRINSLIFIMISWILVDYSIKNILKLSTLHKTISNDIGLKLRS